MADVPAGPPAQAPGMRRLLLLIGSVIFAETMFYAVITPLLPHLAAEYHLSKGQAGILAGAYPAGTVAAAIPTGWLAARVGVRPTVLFGLGLIAASSIAFAFAGTAVLLDAARLAQGVGGAAAWSGGFGWLVRVAPVERRGATIGAVMGVAVAGVVFGPVLGAVASGLGDEPVFCVVAALNLGLFGWAFATWAPAPAGRADLKALGEAAFRERRVGAGMWLISIPGLVFGTVGVLAPLRLDALGAGAAGVAVVFLVASGVEAVTSPLAGRLSDRRGRLLPSLVGLAGGAFALVLLPWPASAWLIGALVVINSALVGFLWAPASALIADGAESLDIEPGFAYALTNLAWSLGQVAGAAGSARLAEATRDAVPYVALAVICASTFVLLARRATGLRWRPLPRSETRT
jgi:MFS family permease